MSLKHKSCLQQKPLSWYLKVLCLLIVAPIFASALLQILDKIEKAWREPGIRLFQVKTLDNKRFRLYYNETDKQWSITELVGS